MPRRAVSRASYKVQSKLLTGKIRFAYGFTDCLLHVDQVHRSRLPGPRLEMRPTSSRGRSVGESGMSRGSVARKSLRRPSPPVPMPHFFLSLRGGVVRDLQKPQLFFAPLQGRGDICVEDPSLIW